MGWFDLQVNFPSNILILGIRKRVVVGIARVDVLPCRTTFNVSQIELLCSSSYLVLLG